MSDPYSMMPSGGEPDADDAGGAGTMSPEDASYRKGNPIKHCGVCTNYTGGACKVVAGPINPYMVSNEFNPWRPNPLHEDGVHFHLKGTDVWRQKREARREETGKGTRGQAKKKNKPKTHIGNKTYD